MKRFSAMFAILIAIHFTFAMQNPAYDFNACIKPYAYKEVKKSFIDYIMQHEGYSDTVYLCPSNYKTIGYGHRVLKGEVFSRLTKKQAKELLEKDFSKALRYARLDNLPKEYELPVAHFIYCLGVGNYQKSTFRSYLRSGNVRQACVELRKWVYVNGRKNQNLIKQRNFEAKALKQAYPYTKK